VACRILIAVLLGLILNAQAPPTPVEPPEEDESLIRPQQYSFNPLQARKELTAGDFYEKKGNHKAAAARYQEATLWDDSWPDAYLKLGETREKLKQYEPAREAFQKFIELTPDKKKAESIQKRIAKYPKK